MDTRGNTNSVSVRKNKKIIAVILQVKKRQMKTSNKKLSASHYFYKLAGAQHFL